MTEGTRVKQSTKERFNMYTVELSYKELHDLVPIIDVMEPQPSEMHVAEVEHFAQEVIQVLNDYHIYAYTREDINKHYLFCSGAPLGTLKLKDIRKLINNLAEEMYAEVWAED